MAIHRNLQNREWPDAALNLVLLQNRSQ